MKKDAAEQERKAKITADNAVRKANSAIETAEQRMAQAEKLRKSAEQLKKNQKRLIRERAESLNNAFRQKWGEYIYYIGNAQHFSNRFYYFQGFCLNTAIFQNVKN